VNKVDFKVGDRVIGKGDSHYDRIKGKEGIVREIRSNELMIEFDKYISGHTGNWCIQGKSGHCWHVREYDIELVVKPNLFMDSVGDKFKGRRASVIQNGNVYKLVKADGKVLYTYIPTKDISSIAGYSDKTEKLYIDLFEQSIEDYKSKKE
jgi:hypothetical protein